VNESATEIRERQVAEFIGKLAKLEDGDRARLKRNAGKSIADSRDVQLLFYGRVLPHGVPVWLEERYFLLATLYPLDKQQRERDRRARQSGPGDEPGAARRALSLGGSFRRARTDLNQKGLDSRFARLLDADTEALPFHLRQAIRRLTNDGAHIDWVQLTHDVLRWHYPERSVQRQWARDYVAHAADAADALDPGHDDAPALELETETETL
jgi:CRISPR system Cascade subunit CasB